MHSTSDPADDLTWRWHDNLIYGLSIELGDIRNARLKTLTLLKYDVQSGSYFVFVHEIEIIAMASFASASTCSAVTVSPRASIFGMFASILLAKPADAVEFLPHQIQFPVAAEPDIGAGQRSGEVEIVDASHADRAWLALYELCPFRSADQDGEIHHARP